MDRLRTYYKGRFDFKVNLLDWNYQQVVKQASPIVHWREYKRFGTTGVSFEARLSSYSEDNPTLLYPKGQYLGDIVNSPFVCVAKKAVNSADQERLFKKVNGEFKSNANEIAEYNLLTLMDERFSLPEEHENERNFPFLSAMSVAAPKIEEVTSGESTEFRLADRGIQKVHFLTGDVDRISAKYRETFDVVFVGVMASWAFLKDPQSLASVLALNGGIAVFETMDNQVLVNKETKANWKLRVKEAAMNLGWSESIKQDKEEEELLIFKRSS
jgi:hypothetical protein